MGGIRRIGRIRGTGGMEIIGGIGGMRGVKGMGGMKSDFLQN